LPAICRFASCIRWKPSDYAKVFKFALETVQSIKAEVGQAAGLTDAQNLKKWSLNLIGLSILAMHCSTAKGYCSTNVKHTNEPKNNHRQRRILG